MSQGTSCSSRSTYSLPWEHILPAKRAKVPIEKLHTDCDGNNHSNVVTGDTPPKQTGHINTYPPGEDSSSTVPRRWRRDRSHRPTPSFGTRSTQSTDRHTVTRTASMSSWTEDATTLAAHENSLELPPPSWCLKLPDAVTTTPSLLTLTHEELRIRGVWTPRPTFESTRVRPSFSIARPTTARTMSIRSALSNFAPHPEVRPLLYNERVIEPLSNANHDTEVYPSSLPLALIILGICLSVFIISLDRGITTTAIPSIVIEFQSYPDIGWYGSAYLLMASAFQPLYGRIYTSFNVKWSFLVAVAIFEVGSLVCAISPQSRALILGRAVQGLGSAGILTGSFVVGTHSVRLASRPILFAFVGVLYGTGALVGPMLGGVFSQLTTWRWCFYINLPIGAITFVSVFCFFDPRGSQKMPGLGRQTSDLTSIGNSFFRRLKALDWIGNTLFTSACTFLFLALQWSQERSSGWSSARCIATIVLSGTMFSSFGVWLWWQGDEALIPLHILRQRTVAVSCIAAFLIYGTLLIHTYYLPIWFQAIKDKTAIESGIGMIPYMLINAFFSLAAGVFVSKNGLFAPPAIAGCFIATIGAGLLATLQPNTTTVTWAGFEALVSAGLGMAIQQGFSAVQATLPIHEVPIGTAAVVACQSAGGVIFVSVGNTLLQNHLFDANTANTIPGVNIRAVIELGATRFREFVPAESLPTLLNLYNDALQAVFIAAVPLCGLALFCTLFMEWKSIRGGEGSRDEAQTASDLEVGSIPGFSTPELGSDAPTLAHLAPQARARWSQRWKRPRTAPRTLLSTLSVVPELNISEKTLAPFQIKHDGFLAEEMKEVEIQDEIGKAITV